MTTITGLTAERMQEFIDKTIIDANIVAGELIFTLEDDSTVNLGNVVGPVGPEGPPGEDAVAPIADFVSVRKSSNQAMSNDAEVAITFDIEDSDNNTMHDPATNNTRLVCKTDGVHIAMGQLEMAGSGGGQYRMAVIKKNGSGVAETLHGPNTVITRIPVAITLRMVVGEYVELCGIQNSGGSLNANASTYTQFSLVRIGPYA